MYLKQVLFLGLTASFAFTACNSADKLSIDDAINQRERDKGYVIDGTQIVSKTETNGHVKVVFKTVDGDNKTVTDTVNFSRTGDGALVPE